VLLALSCSSAASPVPPTDASAEVADAGVADAVAADAVAADGPAVDAPAADAPAADAPGDGGNDVGLEPDGSETIDAASAGEAGESACTTPTGQYGPFPLCTATPDGMACDLVCQSGCACNQRCKLAGGQVSCVAEGPSFLQESDSCVPTDDQCRPGALCLEESDKDHPACGAHCYRHCRDNSDCANGSKCSVDVQFGASATTYTVCSPPADACNPYGAARCTGGRTDRPYPTFACYVLSSSFPDTAICDCAGTVKTDSPCSYEHECEPGSECVAVPGQQRLCRRVCRVGVTGLPAIGGCPVGMTCTAFPRGTTFGYCH
jgi:hypothetical protein